MFCKEIFNKGPLSFCPCAKAMPSETLPFILGGPLLPLFIVEAQKSCWGVGWLQARREPSSGAYETFMLVSSCISVTNLMIYLASHAFSFVLSLKVTYVFFSNSILLS